MDEKTPKTSISEYNSWEAMIQRCHNPNSNMYYLYGARGITVCDEWRSSSDMFLEDMGCKPSKTHSLDRIDNNKGYCKENCRWATKSEQRLNQRPASRPYAQRNNQLGVKGVYFDRYKKKFKVSKCYGKEVIFVGYYKTLEEAKDAYTKFTR